MGAGSQDEIERRVQALRGQISRQGGVANRLVGGQEFAVQAGPTGGSAQLSWLGGSGQTGYAVVRTAPGGPVLLPALLGANQTSYLDPGPLTEAFYFYTLVTFGSSSQIVAVSDVLGLLPVAPGGSSPPPNFQVRLNETTTARLSWGSPLGTAPPAVSSYLLYTVPLNGGPVRTAEFGPDVRRAADDTRGVPTCYLLLAFAGQTPVGNTGVLCVIPSTTIKINEVESNGGTPGDWVELYNTGAAPVDISGFVFKDDDDSRNYAIPAGTTIAGNGYYILEEAAFGFGLGAADAARLYAPGGTVLVDSYAWTAHALTTYGRCPNGIGAFQTTTTVTKGAAIDCSVAVVINEVESNGGTPGDWVELYNPSPSAANLAGFVFRDNDDTHTYVIPAGTTIAGNGYFVLEEAAFGFGLGAPDSARLFHPDGSLADSYAWTAHATTTYGRCPNATGAFTTTTSTKGAVNDCGVPMTVKINEIESNGGTPGDWVELYNTGTSTVDLSGWMFKDNDDTRTFAIAAGSTIPAGGYYLLEEAAFGFGLGAADAARLYAPGGTQLLDSYEWTAHATTTYGRCPNGTGGFTTTASVTKGAANDCSAPGATTVKINEIESSGGTPGDWVELYNTGATAVDLAGWIVKDNDDTHVATLPAGSTIAAGGYFIVEEAMLGFGLGSPDAVRLYAPGGTTLVDSYDWTPHAATTYGRCPNGTGPFTTTTSVTKGAANDCGVPVKINEVESNQGTPGDWVELFNPSPSAVDLSGFVFKDNDDTHAYAIPAGTSIAGNGYYLLEEAAFGFGLGAADSARLFAPGGTTLVDSYEWTAHATTTYGRCPNGTGAFTTTTSATKGTANACPGEVTASPWPGSPDVQTVDGTSVFGGNLSGLTYEPSGTVAPGVLWAVRNGPGTLFRLIWNGTIWTPDPANDWGAGKTLHYPNGTGNVDSEGVTFAANVGAGLYVSTERNNDVSGTSRNSVLLFDPAAAGTTLNATHEWNLTADLPSVGANAGIEAITWVPDVVLTAQGFFDESKGHAYVPAEYPNHGVGLFFVGLEANGVIYAYALNHADSSFTRIATITSGFAGVMALEFDRELGYLWAVCDDGCGGRSAVLEINPQGRFVVTHVFERPATMPNVNNEGFAFAPLAECVNNLRPALWTDDSETGGHALRRGSLTCTPF